ncbi:MAG: hypothetical protein ABEI75_03580 [Halobaculum sp.]
MTRAERGQMVLLAAAVAAVALLAVAAAYVQLGVHPDVTARTDPGVTPDRVLAGLDRAVVNASTGVSGAVAWDDRDRALARFETAFAADVRAIRRAAANRTTLVRVERNGTAARAWADAACPSGENRVFGDCVVRDGVVLQERDGDTHLLAVGLDVTVADPDGETRLTVVLRTV